MKAANNRLQRAALCAAAEPGRWRGRFAPDRSGESSRAGGKPALGPRHQALRISIRPLPGAPRRPSCG